MVVVLPESRVRVGRRRLEQRDHDKAIRLLPVMVCCVPEISSNKAEHLT